jgi:hypothetical protein
MALDKWQVRAVTQHAADNGLTEAEALAELHPDEVPARPRKAAAGKVDTGKAPE